MHGRGSASAPESVDHWPGVEAANRGVPGAESSEPPAEPGEECLQVSPRTERFAARARPPNGGRAPRAASFCRHPRWPWCPDANPWGAFPASPWTSWGCLPRNCSPRSPTWRSNWTRRSTQAAALSTCPRPRPGKRSLSRPFFWSVCWAQFSAICFAAGCAAGGTSAREVLESGGGYVSGYGSSGDSQGSVPSEFASVLPVLWRRPDAWDVVGRKVRGQTCWAR